MSATSLPLKPVKQRSWLLAITLAPWNYALSFVADATVTLALLTWSALTFERTGAVVPVAASALLSYTLMEYLMHRFAFHGRSSPRVFREGHGRHHATPEAGRALPFFVSLPNGIVLWGFAAAVLGPSLGALFAGVCGVGYLTYGGLHHLVHTRAARYPPVTWFRAVHDVHHTRFDCNFGVTTPLWDLVFGTWSPPKRA